MTIFLRLADLHRCENLQVTGLRSRLTGTLSVCDNWCTLDAFLERACEPGVARSAQ
ncbi:MAG TPA: hypothetical protein VHT75_20045 [Acidimicrobiales bacterium]|nr:hypothetical protein [Acidimicrobiales bacterium]